MNSRRDRFTISLLCALLLFVAAGWTECSKEQKQQVVSLSLSHLCDLLSGKEGLPGDVGAAVCAYQSDREESVYQKGLDAFNAALSRHDLPATAREAVRLGEELFRAFAPATFAEMDPGSTDARAAQRELERKFKRLEQLVGR